MTPVLLTERPTTLLVPAPIEDATRREFITGVGAAALAAAFLAACGEEAEDTAEATEAAATRIWRDARGIDVEIPTRPQRIVALHIWSNAPALLSIGAPVVGIPKNADGSVADSLTPYDTESISSIGLGNEPDFEVLAALDPDLIVAFYNGFTGVAVAPGDEPERLTAIAPTVWLSNSIGNEAYMQTVGDLTGLDGEVQRQRDEFEARLESLRASRDDWNSLSYAALSSFDGAAITVEAPNFPNAPVTVLEALGARAVPVAVQVMESGGATASISVERLPEADADIVLWYARDGATDLTSLPNWDSLAASRAGQTYPHEGVGSFSYPTFMLALDILEPILAEADSGLVDESAWR